MDQPAAKAKPNPEFPNRAAWLAKRLLERAWNPHDVQRHGQGGPDHKTVQKILDGLPVREDVPEKVAIALSKKFGEVKLTDIPTD